MKHLDSCSRRIPLVLFLLLPLPLVLGTSPAGAMMPDDRAAIREQAAALDADLARGERARQVTAALDRVYRLLDADQPAAARDALAVLLELDPEHAEARLLAVRLGMLPSPRYEVRREMLGAVDTAWARPAVYPRTGTPSRWAGDDTMRARLEQVAVPHVSFRETPLAEVAETLAQLSADTLGESAAINFLVRQPGGETPIVTLTLRNLTLLQVLDLTCEAVGYEYDLRPEVVVLRPSHGAASRLETGFFPLSRSAQIRLTGVGDPLPGHGDDPLVINEPNGAGPTAAEASLRAFFTRAGVPFDEVPGAALALADGQLIVTQTPANLRKVRDILRRYSEVKQVEIEARFLEVAQGDLEELGVNWSFTNVDNADAPQHRGQTQNRSLANAFGTDRDGSSILIDGQPVPGTEVLPPGIPGEVDLAAAAGALGSFTGILGEFQVSAVIRALARKSGSDLLSAPKITVLSGKTAEIVVAKEMRYPQAYDPPTLPIGDTLNSVALASGVPRDFTTVNIGVEMAVTPTVEDDGSISLRLQPEVREFDGFMEFGGANATLAGNRSIIIPSGYNQPLFSVRRIETEVTIWDGATVVMGGLAREEAISVDDKVPVLGDIPLMGKLFRSKGESTQKRNLLVFVTANLVNPGGALARQGLREVPEGGMYQQRAWESPGGAEGRGRQD